MLILFGRERPFVVNKKTGLNVRFEIIQFEFSVLSDQYEYLKRLATEMRGRYNVTSDTISLSLMRRIYKQEGIHGNIKADSTSRGQIKVDGTVDGDVIHEGSGAIEINGGSVGGNIDMKGSGNVAVNDFSTVDGDIKSEGGGSVDVDGSSTVVDGDVQNPGGGPCTVDLAGGVNVDGNLEDNCVDG